MDEPVSGQAENLGGAVRYNTIVMLWIALDPLCQHEPNRSTHTLHLLRCVLFDSYSECSSYLHVNGWTARKTRGLFIQNSSRFIQNSKSAQDHASRLFELQGRLFKSEARLFESSQHTAVHATRFARFHMEAIL